MSGKPRNVCTGRIWEVSEAESESCFGVCTGSRKVGERIRDTQPKEDVRKGRSVQRKKDGNLWGVTGRSPGDGCPEGDKC